MPQLEPFYFTNQLFYGFGVIGFLTVVFSLYVLPKILELFLARVFISKL